MMAPKCVERFEDDFLMASMYVSVILVCRSGYLSPNLRHTSATVPVCLCELVSITILTQNKKIRTSSKLSNVPMRFVSFGTYFFVQKYRQNDRHELMCVELNVQVRVREKGRHDKNHTLQTAQQISRSRSCLEKTQTVVCDEFGDVRNELLQTVVSG